MSRYESELDAAFDRAVEGAKAARPGLVPQPQIIQTELRCPTCRAVVERRLDSRLNDSDEFFVEVKHIDGPLGVEHVPRPRRRR